MDTNFSSKFFLKTFGQNKNSPYFCTRKRETKTLDCEDL